MDRVAELVEELDALHRGRGFHADDIAENLGPRLSEIVFADNEPEAAFGRDVLRRWLLAAASDLPEDLRRVFLAASGLRDPHGRLGERLAALADATGLSVRTLRRRLREADQLAAEALERRTHVTPDANPFAARGWYVDRLVSIAHLDEPRPRFESVRDIVVTLDGMEEICESWSIPRLPHEPQLTDLDLVATEGCVIHRLEKISPSTWRVTARLPKTLALRERHRVGLAITLPSRAYVRPFNAFVPVRRTRSFRAEVHYGPSTGLTSAWLINGVPPVAMDDAVPLGEQLDLTSGEPLVAEWTTVRRGLGYGIGWTWDD